MIDLETSIPIRSNAGLAALDIFYKQPSGINFYVEDSDQENLYFEILRKLFPKIEISKIFPLGGKQNVLSHAQDSRNHIPDVVSIYIVDKDFDDLLGHRVRKENIFYLDRYCVENYLLEEEAVIQIGVECEPKKKREVIAAILKFEEFLQESVIALDLLFRLFFVVQRFNLGLPNCDLKPEQFYEQPFRWKIQRRLVDNYKKEVMKKVKATGVFKSNKHLSAFVKTAFPLGRQLDANISGKFLVRLLFHYLRAKIALGNCSHDSLCYRLAKNGNLNSLQPLKRRITSYLHKSK